MEFDRIGAGTAAHSLCASRAVRHASTKVLASPKEIFCDYVFRMGRV